MSTTFAVTSKTEFWGFGRVQSSKQCYLMRSSMIFFFCTKKGSVHNFTDDNTLSFPKSVTLLVEILMAESQKAIKWFSENKMIGNPDKFKSIIIQKSNQTSKRKQLLIGNNVVEVASLVKLLGIHIDDQLSFKLHTSNICKSTWKTLNALVRLYVSWVLQKESF